MNCTVRNDERKKIQAILEQRALDKVLNSMTDTHTKSDISEKKFINRFAYNKKRALHKYLQDVQLKWMIKHELPKKLYNQFY